MRCGVGKLVLPVGYLMRCEVRCGVGKLVLPVGYPRSAVWGRQARAPCRIS